MRTHQSDATMAHVSPYVPMCLCYEDFCFYETGTVIWAKIGWTGWSGVCITLQFMPCPHTMHTVTSRPTLGPTVASGPILQALGL